MQTPAAKKFFIQDKRQTAFFISSLLEIIKIYVNIFVSYEGYEKDYTGNTCITCILLIA